MSDKETQLLGQLAEQRLASERLEQELNQLKIQNEIELEKQKQQQWAVAIGKVKEIQETSRKQHEAQLSSIQEFLLTSANTGSKGFDDKLKALLLNDPAAQAEKERKEREEQEKLKNKERLQQILEQHKQLQREAAALADTPLDTESRELIDALLAHNSHPTNPHPGEENTSQNTQQQLLEQLRKALGPKETPQEDRKPY